MTKLLDIKAAAELLSISKSTIRKYIKRAKPDRVSSQRRVLKPRGGSQPKDASSGQNIATNLPPLVHLEGWRSDGSPPYACEYTKCEEKKK